MGNLGLNILRNWMDRFFPERQIYHRSEGKVTYISLTPHVQIFGFAILGALLFWISYASVSVFTSGHLFSSQSLNAQESRAKVQRLLSEARAKEASARTLLESRTSDFASAATEFEQRLDTLKLLLDHVNTPTLSADLRTPPKTGTIVMTPAALDPNPRQSRPLHATAVVADNPPMARLARLENEQNRLLRKTEEATAERVENLRAVLQFAGLNADEILAQDSKEVGGPFIAMSDTQVYAQALDLDNQFARRVMRVTARMAEIKQLERSVKATPLGTPILSEHRRTSKFGSRVDPITGKPALHAGQDFGAFRLAPIGAASAGKVIYAGWKSGYGRFVEIDHGYGFRTRYAHMAKLLVKRGQKVEEGEKIGLMGSSGRSTGVHLHYEIWHNGKIYDPENFLKAGLYVQQKG